MADSLKRKTGLALFWSFIDKGGQQIIQFVIFYILARLVATEEFGLIGLLAVFTLVANILQESGFSSALIRKKDVLSSEYSAVFYFNISISIFIYILFFFCAPFISSFYEQPVLTDLSRFIFLAFVFSAFGIVQNVNLVRKLDFKTNTRITLSASLISGIVAIVMAYKGFGIWSLATQIVLQSFLRSVLLWLFVKWVPDREFRFIHIREMMPYSVKILLTSLMNQICNNILPLIIGKKYSFTQVAFYERGNKLNNIPQSIIADGIKSVAYPLLSSIGEDNVRGKKIFRKVVRITCFISFPVAVLLVVVAKPVVALYLPPEWNGVVAIMQILAIGGAFYPMYNLISSLLQYKGKSGMLFNVELIRNSLLLISVLISFNYGVLGLVTGISIVNIVSFFTGIYIAGRFISYSMKEVLKDILPYLGVAVVSVFPFFFLDRLGIENVFLLLFIPLIVGGLLYLLIVRLLGSVVIKDTIEFVKHSFKKNK